MGLLADTRTQAVALHEKALTKAQKYEEEAEKEIQSLKDRILNAGGPKLKEAREEVSVMAHFSFSLLLTNDDVVGEM